MTDKQILIDGVDVSGCKNFYAKTKDCVQEDTIDTPCVDHPNCHYKQFKRKEQELETICKAFDIEYAIDEETGSLIGRSNKLQKKEQECEELKIYIESNKQQIKEVETLVMDNDRLINELDKLKKELAISIQENEEGREINAELKAENEKLKIYKSITPLKVKKLVQILTEIKSILELYANSKVGEEQPDGTYQLSSGICGSFGFGFCTTTYDPRPARQALQKISEVEDGRN